MNALTLAVLVFVCYRISRLIAVDIGPFDIFSNIRAYLGRLTTIRTTRLMHAIYKTLADLINCQFCVGVWVALILSLLFMNDKYNWFIVWMAIAGGQAFLVEMVGINSDE